MTKAKNIVPLDGPVFFQPNRVWRCYKGGSLLDDFIGNPNPADGFFPENWLASTTIAQNRANQQHPMEGMSLVQMPDGSKGPSFLDVLKDNPAQTLGVDCFSNDSGIDVLCKFVDSAIRLPIQCHPDISFARKYFNSEHGKTESWLVLGTRKINGEEPYLLMGFKPDVDPESFKQAAMKQDITKMERSLHRIDVKPGDMYFVPGRLPHAIGTGVFMLEVQEPTDWVIQPERFIGTVELSDSDMWGPLDPATALDCFDYTAADSLENTLEKLTIRPQTILQDDSILRETIIGPELTDCFRVDRITVNAQAEFDSNWPWHIVVVTQGTGCVQTPASSRPVQKGDCFFVPNAVEKLKYTVTDDPISAFIITR